MIDKVKYEAAYRRCWAAVESECKAINEKCAAYKRRTLLVWLTVFAVGVVLVGIGVGLFAAGSFVAPLLLVLAGLGTGGCAVYLGWTRYFRRVYAEEKIKLTRDFACAFITAYVKSAWRGVEDVVVQKEQTPFTFMGMQACNEYREYENGLAVLDCRMVDYLYRTGDVGMMLDKGFPQAASFNSAAKLTMLYNRRRIAVFDCFASLEKTRKLNWGDTYELVRFDGVLIASERRIAYPHRLEIFKDGGLHSRALAELRHEMASEDFNKRYRVRVDSEDGVALRKAIQPRMLAKMADLDERIALITSGPGLPASLYAESRGLRLHEYDYRRIFAGDAWEMVWEKTVPLFEALDDSFALIDCDLLV